MISLANPDLWIGTLTGVIITRLWTDLKVWRRIARWKARRWDRSYEAWRTMLRGAIASGDRVGETIAETQLNRALAKYQLWRKRGRG